MERTGVSGTRIALRPSGRPLRGSLADNQTVTPRRPRRFLGTVLSSAKLRDRTPRPAARRTAADGGMRTKKSTHAQAHRKIRGSLEHGVHGQAGNNARALRQNRRRVPQNRTRSENAWSYSVHRPLVPRPPGKETQILRQYRQSSNRLGRGDRNNNARLRKTQRATHHVSVRALS